MPFEGFENKSENSPTPFEKMAEERRKSAIENAEDAEWVEVTPEVTEDTEEIPEDGNLNLEKISHLEMFLESAEDVYADALLYEAQAMAERYKSLNVFTAEGEEVEGREVFEVLYDILQEFQVKMDTIRYEEAPEKGFTDADTVPITSEDVHSLQTLYDEMILLRNHIFSAYKNTLSENEPKIQTPESEPDVEKTTEKSHTPQWEFTSSDTEKTESTDQALEDYRHEVEVQLRAFLEEKGVKRIEGRLQKSVALAESVAELDQIKQNILHSPEFSKAAESSPVDTEREIKIKQLRQSIKEAYDGITQTREAMEVRFPLANRTAEEESVLDILTVFVNRASLIHNKANNLDEQDVSVVQGTLEKYLKSTELIQKESEVFADGLATTVTEKSELEETENQSPEIIVPSLEDAAALTEIDVVPKEVTAEVKIDAKETLDTTASENEAIVKPEMSAQEQTKRLRDAMELAYQNMFLSTTEIETVKAFQKQVKRLIETDASAQKITVMIESLENLVSDLTEHPSIEHVSERMEKVMAHVNSEEKMQTDMRMTANSLSEVVNRLLKQRESDESVTDQRVINAYKTLETFANDNESQWLTVCGMQIPQAGPEAVFGARSFREGLMVVRDRHPVLVRSLSKQLFVDDIIRMLQTVPNTGLTEKQVEKITWLAREIDVPDRLVAAKQAENNVKTQSEKPKEAIKTTSVHVETPVEKVAEAKKRATLEVVSQDEEVTVEIDVARMAETIIVEEAAKTASGPKAIFNSLNNPVNSKAYEAAEDFDPINEVVPAEKVPHVRTREKIKEDSLTRKHLVSAEYSGFLDEHYSSPEAFEKVLQLEIHIIDTQHTDKMAEYFGEKRASAFGLLQDMSIEKIRNLDKQSYEEKVAFLQTQNVSLDSVVVWLDMIGEMTSTVGENPDMRLGELFARWMIETEMTYFDGGTSASQFTL